MQTTNNDNRLINVNAKHLNNLFCEELRKFKYNKKVSGTLKREIKRILEERLEDQFKQQIQMKKELTELNGKIEKLEKRFIESEIYKELFDKYLTKYQSEKNELELKISTQPINSSNLEKIVEKGLGIAENLSQLWVSGDFDEKRKLQSLVFPEGIVYSKKKDSVRTLRVNSLFAQIPHLVSDLSGNKNGHFIKSDQNSHWVVPTGIEPVSKV